MTQLFKGVLRDRRSAGGEQWRVRIAAPQEVTSRYTAAGMHCEVAADGAPLASFAPISIPGDVDIELLVRAVGDTARAILRLGAGDTLEIAPPKGRGFDLARARGRTVALFASGTGIAPVCACIGVMLRERPAFGALTLYYGVKDREHIAVPEELARYRDAGIHVRTVFSSATTGARYVQHALLHDAPALAGSIWIAAGHDSMLAELRTIAATYGIGPDDVLDNLM